MLSSLGIVVMTKFPLSKQMDDMAAQALVVCMKVWSTLASLCVTIAHEAHCRCAQPNYLYVCAASTLPLMSPQLDPIFKT